MSARSFVRAVGESFRFEVDDATREVTLVIVPFDARAIIPYDVFCRFAGAVADVLKHLGKPAEKGKVPS